ncbi:MAG: hypothetical protein ABIO96_14500 [Nitrospiraceae bacterium]
MPCLILAYRFVDLPRQLPSFFPAIEILKSRKLHLSVNLAYLVEEVCLVYLVYLVYLVGLVCPVDHARAIS